MKLAIFGAAFLVAAGLAGSDAFAMDDAAFCTQVKTVVDSENAKGSYDIDAVTKAVGANYDCGTKSVEFKRTIAATQDQMKEGWRDLLLSQWNQLLCADPSSKEAVQSGWTLTDTFTLTDGVTYSAKANCP